MSEAEACWSLLAHADDPWVFPQPAYEVTSLTSEKVVIAIP